MYSPLIYPICIIVRIRLVVLRWKKRGVFALAFVGVALVVMTFVLASNLGRSPDPSIIVPDYGLDEVVCVPHDSGE